MDTYYSLEFFKKILAGNKLEIDSYNISHATIIKQTNEWVGTSTHHDTITGTSPNHVIQNETSTVSEKAFMNGRVFGASLREIIKSEEGLVVDAMEACLKRSHMRDTCPTDMLIGDRDLYQIVYNPRL